MVYGTVDISILNGLIKQQTSLWGQKIPRIWILCGGLLLAHCTIFVSWAGHEVCHTWLGHQMGHQNEGRTNQKMRSNPSKQENIWREDQPKWDIYIYIPPDWKLECGFGKQESGQFWEKSTAKRPHSNLGKILELRMRPGLRLILGSKSMVAHGTNILSLLKSGPARKPPHRFCSRVSFFTMIQTLKLNLGPFLLSKNIFWKTRQHSNFQSGGKIIYVIYIYI